MVRVEYADLSHASRDIRPKIGWGDNKKTPNIVIRPVLSLALPRRKSTCQTARSPGGDAVYLPLDEAHQSRLATLPFETIFDDSYWVLPRRSL